MRKDFRRATGLALAIAATWLAGSASPLAVADPADSPGAGTAPGTAGDVGYAPERYRERRIDDEIVYFVLPDRFENGDPSNDRGGLPGGRLVNGYDPTDSGFYHGGDLKGLSARLDYIQRLGATAIWITPPFVNKPVQGAAGHASAGYHGYWITDFTRVDPHLGSRADLQAFIDAAHARGMKVYLDIVVNHTADVIRYRECPNGGCPYRSRAAYPYTRRGGVDGAPINDGFLGDGVGYRTAENFAKLTRPDYAYTPYVPSAEASIKAPAWLNDPIYYHNRGNSTFHGESAELGDFGGLDDLMTENPRVLAGFIDLYGGWIEGTGIDGYRIDTAKHVDAQFWQSFAPAMQARAAARGIPHFALFGEVFTDREDPALLARHTRVDRLPAVLDFALAAALRATVAGRAGTERLSDVLADDVLYEGGAAAARELPTFVSNHDMGRFGYFVRKARPAANDAEALARVSLAYTLLFTLRGVPVVYYGDEQGFAGSGGDRQARQDMFTSRTPAYATERPIGGAGGSRRPFDESQPLYRHIAALARLRRAQPLLREGLTTVRADATAPGLFAFSRIDPNGGGEILVAVNTSTTPLTAQVEVDPRHGAFRSLLGACAARTSAPGSYPVRLAPLAAVVCAAEAP